MRLMQVAHDPRCSKSGVCWSWNGGPREGARRRSRRAARSRGRAAPAALGLDLRERPVEQGARHRARRRPLPALDAGDGRQVADVSVAVSPCPTLRVIGALTERSNKKQDAKRKKQDATMPALASKPTFRS